MKWFARATSEENAKKKWDAIWKKAKAGQTTEDMAEKYKQYRVGNTRLIRPPLDKGKASLLNVCFLSHCMIDVIPFSFSGTVVVMVW